MNTIRISIVIVTAVLLSACTSAQYYQAREHCRQNTAGCVLLGAAVVGGVILIASEIADDDDDNAALYSDLRLKEHVTLVKQLDNGLRIHAFSYRGDNRIFTGVLAQEILAMPQFADAVAMSEDGYYRVDYAKLGLRLFNHAAIYEAGEQAAKAAAI